ncbi:MAG: cytochrome P460 family protein [Myxococcota bacterium]
MACGGGNAAKETAKPAAKEAAKAADPNAQFGPLEIGADWKSYAKVNSEPVFCEDHGKRFCDTYVNDVGVEAYKNEDAEIPVGTIVVKTSWENQGGAPSDVPGPIFVMEKRAAGFDTEHGDWYYAMHWEKPTAQFAKALGGPTYWRSPSKRVAYCFGCHDGYDRQLGMVPEEKRAW